MSYHGGAAVVVVLGSGFDQFFSASWPNKLHSALSKSLHKITIYTFSSPVSIMMPRIVVPNTNALPHTLKHITGDMDQWDPARIVRDNSVGI